MKNYKIKLKKSGFTLIELIVSITIIAVMTVVAAVSFTGVGRKSRDARRISDLQKIAMALEMVKQQGTGSSYPATCSASSCVLVTGGFLQFWPVGPKGDTYTYTRDSTSIYKYTIQANVEDAGSSNVVGGIYQLSNP